MREPIVQRLIREGRPLTVTWQYPPFEPPLELTTQAYGICFTDDGQILLISSDGEKWNLPGGTREDGETLTETLTREVWEEACAEVVQCQYIGCQRINDPQRSDGLPRYYQARYWARVTLKPFVPEFETIARRLVRPDQFLTTLSWGTAPIARIIFEAGLNIEDFNSI